MEEVKIIATGKAVHMPKGKEYLQPADMAELLVRMGAAQYAEAEKQKQFEISKNKKVDNIKKNKHA